MFLLRFFYHWIINGVRLQWHWIKVGELESEWWIVRCHLFLRDLNENVNFVILLFLTPLYILQDVNFFWSIIFYFLAWLSCIIKACAMVTPTPFNHFWHIKSLQLFTNISLQPFFHHNGSPSNIFFLLFNSSLIQQINILNSNTFN